MITAILLCALGQLNATVELDAIPPCPNCDALMSRVASLEAQLKQQAAPTQAQAPRRVRLIEVPDDGSVPYAAPPPTSCYSTQAAPATSYAAPPIYSRQVTRIPAYVEQSFSSASYGQPPADFSFERRGLLGRPLFSARSSAFGTSFERRGLLGQRFSLSACGPNGCP